MACNQVTLIENGSTHDVPFYLNLPTGQSATNVVGTFTVPGGLLTINSISAVDATATPVGSETAPGEYTIPSMTGGNKVTILVNVTVDDDSDISLLAVTGVFVSDEADSNPVNNTLAKSLCEVFNSVDPSWYRQLRYCLNDENDPSDIFADPLNPTTAEVQTWAQGALTTNALFNGTMVVYDPVSITYNTVYSWGTGWMDRSDMTADQDYLKVNIGGTDYASTITMVTSGSPTGGADALIDTHITNSLTTEGYTVNSVTVVWNATTLVYDVDVDITGVDSPSITLYSTTTSETDTGTASVIQTGTVDCDEPTYVWSLNQKAQDASDVIIKIRG